MSLREISRRLRISRNTVRAVIKQEGKIPDCVRKDKIHIDQELLERLHQECDGWIQRIHEKLTEDEGVQVGYPTLTRMLRELGISRAPPILVVTGYQMSRALKCSMIRRLTRSNYQASEPR